jgi:hypothetical protein
MKMKRFLLLATFASVTMAIVMLVPQSTTAQRPVILEGQVTLNGQVQAGLTVYFYKDCSYDTIYGSSKTDTNGWYYIGGQCNDIPNGRCCLIVTCKGGNPSYYAAKQITWNQSNCPNRIENLALSAGACPE